MKKKVKDDFNVTSNLRYELQRATLIANDFGFNELDTFAIVISMFKDPYSKLNEIYFENGIQIYPDVWIKFLIQDKDIYERVFKREYPFNEEVQESQSNNLEEKKSEENTDDQEKDKNIISEVESKELNLENMIQNLEIIFYPENTNQEIPINYETVYSKNFKKAFLDAGQRCRDAGQDYIDEENLLYSILNLEECSAKRFLEEISEELSKKNDVEIDIIDLIESLIASSEIHFIDIEKKVNIPKPLENCCTVLNNKYEKGVQCDILGRDEEIYQVWSTLSKNQKSNVILLGEAGVGKSAIVEAITMAIVNGTCPKKFIGYSVIELNVSGMISGTKYRGEFEKKVEYLINFIENNDKIILFVDEIHQMLGAGAGEGSGPDLSGSLKPILARDKVKFIGATTMNEYKKYVCRDNAFRRRLEPVIIDEPKQDKVLPMLKVKIDKLKKSHNVDISEEELVYIKLCASCFNVSTCNPDKTLDLIDKSMAIAENSGKKAVEREDIEKAFSKNYSKFNKLSKEYKLRTSYHEIGHLVIKEYYKDILEDNEVFAVSIVPGLEFLGANILESTDILVSPDIGYIKAEIAVLVAGRVAESLYSGEKTAGASNDLRRATIWARNTILKYGISNQVEFSDLSLFDEGTSSDIKLTDAAIEKVNKEARKLVAEVISETEKIIEEKKEIVKKLAEYVLEKKIVSAEELRDILNN